MQPSATRVSWSQSWLGIIAMASQRSNHSRSFGERSIPPTTNEHAKKANVPFDNRWRGDLHKRSPITDVRLELTSFKIGHHVDGYLCVVLDDVGAFAGVATHGLCAVSLVEEARPVLRVETSVAFTREATLCAHEAAQRGRSGAECGAHCTIGARRRRRKHAAIGRAGRLYSAQ